MRAEDERLRRLMKVEVTCSVIVGRCEMMLGELLSMRRGSPVILDQMVDDPLVLYADGIPIARGVALELPGGMFGFAVREMLTTRPPTA